MRGNVVRSQRHVGIAIHDLKLFLRFVDQGMHFNHPAEMRQGGGYSGVRDRGIGLRAFKEAQSQNSVEDQIRG